MVIPKKKVDKLIYPHTHNVSRNQEEMSEIKSRIAHHRYYNFKGVGVYLKMFLLLFGTISFLVGAVIGSFWYVLGDKTALKKFFSLEKNKTAISEKIYHNPRLELDSLIRAKIFNTNQGQ